MHTSKETDHLIPREVESIRLRIIEPQSGWRLVDFKELWRFRELLYFFTWRDVKVRYKQTLLGAAWAIIQPFMMMVVFTIFLGRMAGVDSGDFPYPVFVYAGLLPWTFFSTAISNSGESVVGSSSIITKVYFPRLAIPFASVGAAVVDFCVAVTMLIVLMWYFGISPSIQCLFVAPLVFVMLILAALGVGTFLSALNVSYRDFKYTIPFLVQLWMFATPTVYMNLDLNPTATNEDTAKSLLTSEESTDPGAGRVPVSIKTVALINPLTATIGAFRASVLGGPIPWLHLSYSIVVVVGMFLAGVLYFRRVEATLVDVI